MNVHALVRLVRAPAALTVPGDVLAGAVSAGRPVDRSVLAGVAASTCLYWAGMALNDYADRELDAVERPERPIPSGAVSAGTALGIAAGLTGAGLALALLAGRRTAAVALPLAAVVWAYDLGLKNTAAGPLTMAAARVLDVLVGAGAGRISAALPTAALIGAHIVTVTHLSRHEVHGTTGAVPGAALAATTAIALTAGRRNGRSRLLGGVYVFGFGRALFEALREPTAARVRTAVGAGINGLIPLQASVLARAGSPTALPVAAAFPLARLLTRRVSPT
jgi:4-hydroxybenzoate polyprenyltransferase